VTKRTATTRPACRPSRILGLAAVVAAIAAAPSPGRAGAPLPDEVGCLDAEMVAVDLRPADLDVGDLRLHPSDFLPPHPETRPVKMVGFGSAMLGIQVTALVLFPPDSLNGRLEPSATQFRSAFTAPPTWEDGDAWVTNYVAHPIMGSLLYTAARRSNYGPVGSFLFATGANTLWEFGVKGWFEQPSWPDLLVTSTGGALIGEARWWARQRLLRGGRPGFWGQLGLAFADPIAEAQLIFQAVAGRKAARDLFGDELL
jgi:hypothetical protein